MGFRSGYSKNSSRLRIFQSTAALIAARTASPFSTVTWSPTNKSASVTLSGGNLLARFTDTNGANWECCAGNLSCLSKGYYEVSFDTGNNTVFVGLCAASQVATGDTYPGNVANSIGLLGVNGQFFVNAGVINTGSTFTTGDIIGIAFDVNTGKVWFAKNNVWMLSGNPAAGTSPIATLSGACVPGCASLNNGVGTFTGRFKSADLVYSPPTGFTAWEP